MSWRVSILFWRSFAMRKFGTAFRCVFRCTFRCERVENAHAHLPCPQLSLLFRSYGYQQRSTCGEIYESTIERWVIPMLGFYIIHLQRRSNDSSILSMFSRDALLNQLCAFSFCSKCSSGRYTQFCTPLSLSLIANVLSTFRFRRIVNPEHSTKWSNATGNIATWKRLK